MPRRLKPYSTPRFALSHPDGGDTTTLPVPGYLQSRNYSCGFASALMVARYCAVTTPAQTLFEALGTGRSGTRQGALVRVLRQSGLSANPRYDLDFQRLRRAIDRGKPIIGYLADAEHWMVIYGYGRGPDRVFVADPRPAEPCEQLWSRYGPRLRQFGIVCSPSSQHATPDRRPAPPAEASRGRRPVGPTPEPRQLSFDFFPG